MTFPKSNQTCSGILMLVDINDCIFVIKPQKAVIFFFYDMADLIIFITNVYVMILEECKNMFLQNFFRKVPCDCMFTLNQKHVKSVQTRACTNVSFLYCNLAAYLSALLFKFFSLPSYNNGFYSLQKLFLPKYYSTFQQTPSL